MEMFSKLHQAYRKVVDIEETGKRYLGTYFRVGFYGKVRGIERKRGRKREREGRERETEGEGEERETEREGGRERGRDIS